MPEDLFDEVILQALALSACTTLVSVEPKLTIETRNHVMKVQFFLVVSLLFNMHHRSYQYYLVSYQKINKIKKVKKHTWLIH